MNGLMHGLFLVVGVLGAAYLSVRRRHFDIPALAFFGACFYFVPGFAGFVAYPEGLLVRPVEIEDETYAVMIFVLVTTLVAVVINDSGPDRQSFRPGRRHRRLMPSAWVASGLAIVGATLTVITVGDELFSADKFRLLDSLNRWHLLWTVSATIAFVMSTATGSVVPAVLSLVLLVANLYVGFRVDLVIAVIGAFTYWLMSQGKERLVAHWKVGISIAVIGLSLFIIKYILVALQLMDLDLLVGQIRNPEAASYIFMYSEPFIAQGTLNEVIRQDYWVGPAHLAELVYLVVPFASELGAPGNGFNAQFQPALFSSVTAYGLGGNIWAEMVASGGWLLLSAFLAAYCLVLVVGDRLVRRLSPEVAAPVLVVLVYWAFYIHRNDLLYQMTLTRRFLLAAATILSVASVAAFVLSSVSPTDGTMDAARNDGTH